MASASLAVALAAAVVPVACGESTPALTSEERIEAAVAEKLASWRGRRATDCARVALAAAQLRADSLILDYAYAQRMMLDRPARPVPPPEPPLRRPHDTLRLEPFLGDTL